MDTDQAVALITSAVPKGPSTWADIGAGDGTFSRALAQLLGPKSRIYAIDRDRRAVAALERWARKAPVEVIPLNADFARPFELPGINEPALDGILLANSLHFVPDAGAVLARLVEWVRPGGRVVLVEYDRRAASRWVPYPIPAASLDALAASAGLSPPAVVATRPSSFGGMLYAAAADKPRAQARG